MSMPIYEVDEHELMKEECVLREGEAEIQDGTLYLTDKRIIYEIKGKRGLIRAAPPKIYMDVRLFELMILTSPRLASDKEFSETSGNLEINIHLITIMKHVKHQLQLW